MAKKVRHYTASEKAKVVLTALQRDLTTAQMSSQYGVHSTQINRWKKEALASIVAGFQNKTGSPEPDQTPLIRQLYEQIGQLTVERDWLKKKSAVFGFNGKEGCY